MSLGTVVAGQPRLRDRSDSVSSGGELFTDSADARDSSSPTLWLRDVHMVVGQCDRLDYD